MRLVVAAPLGWFLEACKLYRTFLKLLEGSSLTRTTIGDIQTPRSVLRPILTDYPIFMANLLSSSLKALPCIMAGQALLAEAVAILELVLINLNSLDTPPHRLVLALWLNPCLAWFPVSP
jgi:hypothetical protein